jgi:hypothetical protein
MDVRSGVQEGCQGRLSWSSMTEAAFFDLSPDGDLQALAAERESEVRRFDSPVRGRRAA